MRLRVLKVLLWLVCLSHLALGLAGVLSPASAVGLVKGFYGAELDATPVQIHLLRIIGAYMIAMGMMGGMAARDPGKHRPFIVTVAALLAIRVLQRVVHAGEIEASFAVGAPRLWIQSGWFALLAFALVYLMPRKTA